MVHGDLTPGNVLVGAGGRVTLIDFSHASRVDGGTGWDVDRRFLPMLIFNLCFASSKYEALYPLLQAPRGRPTPVAFVHVPGSG